MSIENNIKENLNILTDMERKVLSLIAENKTSKEIAQILFISYRTVQNHRYNISQKLNLKGSNKLLEFALSHKEHFTEQSGLLLTTVETQNNTPTYSIPKSKINVGFASIVVLGFILLWIAANQLFKAEDNTSSDSSSTQRRIAVMPLRLIGPDLTNEYLSDGLTDELITQISRIPDIRVIARTSAIFLKDSPERLDEISKELQLNAILEGSIQKDKDLIRVNVQLIDTEMKETIWSQTFDRKFSDILSVQREIGWQVANALKVELLLEGLDAGVSESPLNEDAYTAYLKGRYFVNQKTGEGFNKAIEYFQQAIKADSNYSNAWAGLADTYVWMSNYGFMLPDEAYPLAKTNAEKALELNPKNGEAYTALAATSLLYEWDFDKAKSGFLTALHINPSDVVAHRLYALLLLATGKPEDAIKHTEIGIKLDPLSLISNAMHARTYYFARQYSKALKQLLTAIEIDDKFWLVHSYLGETYIELKDFDKALIYLLKARELAPDNDPALGRLGYGYAITGRQIEAETIINELSAKSDDGKNYSFQIALIYTALGQKDNAFKWIQKAFDTRHDFMLDLHMDPKLDPLRKDPRFISYLRKMGFVD